jgi:hypothetical protein
VFCRAVLISSLMSDLSRHKLLTRGRRRRSLLASLCLGGLTSLFLSIDSLAAGAVEVSASAKQTPTEAQVPDILPQPSTAETPTDALAQPGSQASPPANSPANSQSDARWQTFVSETGQFSVALPSAPATYTFSPDTGASAMYMQMQLVDPGHLEVYAAAFIESAELAGAAANANETLLSCVSGLSPEPPAAAPRAIALDTALGSYSGIEAEFQSPDGSFQVSRCYLVGDRAYMLTTTRERFSAGAGLVPSEASSAASPAPVPQTAPQTVPQTVPQTISQPVLERSPTMEAFFSSFKILE